MCLSFYRLRIARRIRSRTVENIWSRSLVFLARGQVRLETRFCVNFLHQLLRSYLGGIVLGPGPILFVIRFRLLHSVNFHERGTDRRGATVSGHSTNFQLHLLQIVRQRILSKT